MYVSIYNFAIYNIYVQKLMKERWTYLKLGRNF